MGGRIASEDPVPPPPSRPAPPKYAAPAQEPRRPSRWCRCGSTWRRPVGTVSAHAGRKTKGDRGAARAWPSALAAVGALLCAPLGLEARPSSAQLIPAGVGAATRWLGAALRAQERAVRCGSGGWGPEGGRCGGTRAAVETRPERLTPGATRVRAPRPRRAPAAPARWGPGPRARGWPWVRPDARPRREGPLPRPDAAGARRRQERARPSRGPAARPVARGAAAALCATARLGGVGGRVGSRAGPPPQRVDRRRPRDTVGSRPRVGRQRDTSDRREQRLPEFI